jgi:serine/threonine-protein kinase RsbW
MKRMVWRPSDRQNSEYCPSFPEPISMSETQAIWRSDHVIPSRPEESRRVQDEFLAKMEELHWAEHDVFSVRLAMEEALINAIKHGNHYDPAKNVKILCEILADRVRVEILDEGKGFDLSAVPDPTDPDNLESPCGSGLMLMRSFMSRVEFNELGNQVVMEKEQSPPESE